ncbi:MAG: hypothetical protein ABI585_02445 [Betaproteobacteria bacterium]
MKRAVALAALGALAAGCASMPDAPPSDVSLYDDDVAPLIIAMTPQDLQPLEPVEPPLPESPPMPAPSPAPAPSLAPALEPSAAALPRAPASTGVPGENVFAAAAPSALPSVMVLPVDDLAALALIADLQRYNALGPDEARRELALATTALSRERSDGNRVRLAVLYTLSHANAQDDQRALQLLENVAKSGGGVTPVKALAAVLHVQVSDRIRSVRDEQAKANEAIQKLEALRAMERSLLRDRVRSGGGGGGGGGGAGGGGSGGR